MNSLIQGLVAVLIVLVPVIVLTGTVYLGRRMRRLKGKRNPLIRSLLRAPGTSLRHALESSQDDLVSIMIIVSMLGSGLAGVYLGSQLDKPGPGDSFWALAAITSAIILGYAAWSVLRLQQKVYQQRLGLDGEMAVGEELNYLMTKGYRVFHDIPGPNYNVDHVVVGPNGVFAVETKSHPKSGSAFTAEFDGKAIRYPDLLDLKATEQAMRQARSVAKYLSKACGSPVRVCGVVVLPGWNVKQTKRTQGCVVMASGQISKEFPRLKCDALDDGRIQAISHQLEQLCRSESPMTLSESDEMRFAQRATL